MLVCSTKNEFTAFRYSYYQPTNKCVPQTWRKYRKRAYFCVEKWGAFYLVFWTHRVKYIVTFYLVLKRTIKVIKQMTSVSASIRLKSLVFTFCCVTDVIHGVDSPCLSCSIAAGKRTDLEMCLMWTEMVLFSSTREK